MKTEKSAKDKAFDKERVKFRHEIRELKQEIKSLKKEKSELEETISKQADELRSKQDWINRILDYYEPDETKKAQQKKESDIQKQNELQNGLHIGVIEHNPLLGTIKEMTKLFDETFGSDCSLTLDDLFKQ